MPTIETCTIAIAMVKYFRPGELPGGDVQGTPTDVASYRNFYDVAGKIIQSCVREQGKLGWAQTGMLCKSNQCGVDTN